MNSSSLAQQTINQLQTYPTNNPIFKIIHSIIKEPIVPLQIKMNKKKIIMNDKELDLSHKKKIFTIFFEIYKSPQQTISRDYLITKIYPETLNHTISTRQYKCLSHNIIKLVSRSRKLASTTFTHTPHKIDWFPYCSKLKSWKLLFIKNDYGNNLLSTDSD